MLGNQLAKQAKAREAVLILVAFLGLIYIVIDYIYIPKKQKCELLSTQINAIEEKRNALEKLNKALELKHTKMQSEMQKEAQQAEKEDPRILMLKKYRRSMFKNVSDFMNTVMQTTYQARVVIDSIKHETPMALKGFTSTPFIIKFNGRFTNILDFVNKIESIPALITIDKIEIRVGAQDSNLINVEINGTFFKLEKENA